jgi:hypothetical protein
VRSGAPAMSATLLRRSHRNDGGMATFDRNTAARFVPM